VRAECGHGFEHAQLGVGRQAVARLDLDRGRPRAHERVEARAGERDERVDRRGGRAAHGVADAAAAGEDRLVPLAAGARLEVVEPVAGPDEVRVRVDEPGTTAAPPASSVARASPRHSAAGPAHATRPSRTASAARGTTRSEPCRAPRSGPSPHAPSGVTSWPTLATSRSQAAPSGGAFGGS
jgi:hypothetical protein